MWKTQQRKHGVKGLSSVSANGKCDEKVNVGNNCAVCRHVSDGILGASCRIGVSALIIGSS